MRRASSDCCRHPYAGICQCGCCDRRAFCGILSTLSSAQLIVGAGHLLSCQGESTGYICDRPACNIHELDHQDIRIVYKAPSGRHSVPAGHARSKHPPLGVLSAWILKFLALAASAAVVLSAGRTISLHRACAGEQVWVTDSRHQVALLRSGQCYPS